MGLRLIREPLRILVLKKVFLETETKFFVLQRYNLCQVLLTKNLGDFWLLKPDPNMITLSFYKEILRVFFNIQTFSAVVDGVMLCSM